MTSKKQEREQKVASDQNDLRRAQHHMQRYTLVSNAKFNIDKTEAFSLNGKLDNSHLG
ncbi:hypothetical protein INT48_001336 [Thamnidium elegans]|uniref:Uncharacterized protein n=1 Tax=Thamnidium elegans TaxID=101142 RepID=A0A8H7SG29_9FUNG|nr:hypothetical protein INT48_001336 [Thamnidium elegans]